MAIALTDVMLNDSATSVILVRQAIQKFKKIQRTSESSGPEILTALHTSHFLLAILLEQKGLQEEAADVRDRMSQFLPDSVEATLELARAYAWESQLYGRGKPRLSGHDLKVIRHYHRQTIELLESACSRGLSDLKLLGDDPKFMPLFRYRRFRELVERGDQ